MTAIISFIILILIFSGAKQVYGDSLSVKDIKGRLLTPEEGCGLTKVKATRIIGGSNAPVGAWPWMVILGYANATYFNCGGSLITSKHVLSAAHCIYHELKFARLGEHDLGNENDGPHQDIPIARAVAHEHYDPVTYLNDIGIIHLERDVEFSDRIRLPLDEPLRSRSFVGDNPLAGILQQLQVPVVDSETCRHEHMICAGGAHLKGFWKGDSGSPLMLPIHQNGSFPFYQIGVVSFTYGCCLENVPGVYMNVQFYADWIKKQLGNATVDATKSIE